MYAPPYPVAAAPGAIPYQQYFNAYPTIHYPQPPSAANGYGWHGNGYGWQLDPKQWRKGGGGGPVPPTPSTGTVEETPIRREKVEKQNAWFSQFGDKDTHDLVDKESTQQEDNEINTLCSSANNEFLSSSPTYTSSAQARLGKKTSKKSTNKMAEEAYDVMKGFINKKRDEFDICGENVAVSLRKLSKIAATYAKFEINKILFNAELGQYDQPSRLSTPSSTSAGNSAYNSPYSRDYSGMHTQTINPIHQTPAMSALTCSTKTNISPDGQELQHYEEPSVPPTEDRSNGSYSIYQL